MGVGKTLVGLQYIDSLYNVDIQVCIAIPKLSIKDTWLSEMDKHGYSHLKDQVFFTTYLSLGKKDADFFDILILDECHNLTEAHRSWLDKYTGLILGLSGTMPKYHHSEKGKMIADFCPTVYRYSTDEAVEDDILNDYRIIVHEMELSPKKDLWHKSKNGSGWYTSERSEYEYWTGRVHRSTTSREQQIMRVMRMKSLMNFKTKEVYAKKLFESIEDKSIIFCNTQDQAKLMCSESYFSKNPDNKENLRKFKEGEINKLSAVQMLSEGVNIPDLKQAIIMHSFSGSSPKSKQKLGRILRLNPNEIAIMHMLVYKDCMDESWLNSVLEGFDAEKISYKGKAVVT
jgi:superfamily II DNA or RNA helicase